MKLLNQKKCNFLKIFLESNRKNLFRTVEKSWIGRTVWSQWSFKKYFFRQSLHILPVLQKLTHMWFFCMYGYSHKPYTVHAFAAASRISWSHAVTTRLEVGLTSSTNQRPVAPLRSTVFPVRPRPLNYFWFMKIQVHSSNLSFNVWTQKPCIYLSAFPMGVPLLLGRLVKYF